MKGKVKEGEEVGKTIRDFFNLFSNITLAQMTKRN